MGFEPRLLRSTVLNSTIEPPQQPLIGSQVVEASFCIWTNKFSPEFGANRSFGVSPVPTEAEVEVELSNGGQFNPPPTSNGSYLI